MHFLTPGFLKLSVTIAAQLLLIASWYSLVQADSPNRQPWIHVNGNCTAGLEGAVFAISGANCGGNSTSFDTQQIYSPVVIKDVASDAAPCSGIPTGAICWRMWYVGEDAGGRPRIGYAVSPDGLAWSRVLGSRTGGSVFDVGPVGNFDSEGVTYFTIMKDGSTFKMWYSGYGSAFGLTLTEGIGYATSTDGLTWTRVPGSLAGGAVLRASGTSGAFDQHEAYVPYVLKDQTTVQAPCTGIPTGQTCYRMWYEGANTSSGYRFLIGYAISADGVNWTRVPGGGSGGEVLGAGPFGNFDDNSVGIPVVIKEGAFYRMWYEAKDFAAGKFTIGHVISVDGVNWVHPSPNQPIYEGSDDPAATFNPDHIWSHTVLKDGSTYRMWYTVSTKPNAQRFGHAIMTPGAPLWTLNMIQISNNYTVSFTPTMTISATGSILLTLPPDIPFEQVTPGTLTGFGSGATLSAEPAAVSDALAGNTTRGALLIRLTADELVGPKMVEFSLTSPPATAGPLLMQTFDTREVLEYGVVNLPLDRKIFLPLIFKFKN